MLQPLEPMCEPHDAADLVNCVRYQTPNEAAARFVEPAILRLAPSADELERGERMTDLGDFATAYNEAWMKVQGA